MKKIKINLTHTKSNLAKKYIEVQKKNMLIHTKNKTLDAICILEKIEKDLNIEELVRCHKSYITNLNYVENIKSNTAILDSQEEVPISRYRYKDIKEGFLKFIGDRIC
ncbi:LytTR family DNA-binding domain-containing protein [Clostridioides difficile]|uniref:LytR/AlgR family response regulator transcription factor n=6 Tax=Clostridioides difficile TaxID=1496 RepID=UPI00040867A5|nr:LytTR family DNA-binding domain-containing protein [Clostridioides difficile]AUA30421.1 LytTR family transcriptional regulator [Clostridioides difficile]EAA0003656.1 LytTR family transcriptional regulator [Clostridioides difficile]EGT3731305.1 LytTR family transcriptional regulator [Clostridioides difficile]EGT3734018.1 LytTR family transcriptional regulator [Clostridioides difficile]EGT3771757.1 LytTR family transcriptional regulator [Clostridioides difficile]